MGLTGKAAEAALERAGLTCNKNSIPFDTESPFVTSGIRLGSPAGTTRGFKEKEFEMIGRWIGDVLRGLKQHEDGDKELESRIRFEVKELCDRFPIYERK